MRPFWRALGRALRRPLAEIVRKSLLWNRLLSNELEHCHEQWSDLGGIPHGSQEGETRTLAR